MIRRAFIIFFVLCSPAWAQSDPWDQAEIDELLNTLDPTANPSVSHAAKMALIFDHNTTNTFGWHVIGSLGVFGTDFDTLIAQTDTLETLVGQLVTYGSNIDSQTAAILDRLINYDVAVEDFDLLLEDTTALQTLITTLNTLTAAIYTDVIAITPDVDTIRSAAQSINLTTANIDTNIADVETQIVGLRADLLAAVGPVQGLSPIQLYVSNIDLQLQSLNSTLNSINTLIQSIWGQLDSLVAIAEAIQDQIVDLDTNMQAKFDEVIAALADLAGDTDPTEDVDQQPYDFATDVGTLTPLVGAVPNPDDALTVPPLAFIEPDITPGTAPVWNFPADDWLPSGLLSSSSGLAGQSITVDWSFWTPFRTIVHAVIIFFAAVWAAVKCWEEVRRYG